MSLRRHVSVRCSAEVGEDLLAALAGDGRQANQEKRERKEEQVTGTLPYLEDEHLPT